MATLDAHYRATTYRVLVPDGAPIDLRVDEASAPLDLLLTRYGAHAWAFITAWNPASRPLPAAENALRHAALLRAMQERGWRFIEGAGVPDRGDWQAETSALVLGIAEDDAVALGRRFGQNAIVAGVRGGKGTLVYCV